MSQSSFNAADSKTYDDRIIRMVPGYDVMHKLTQVCLAQELAGDARLLMVGAGTGAEIIECGEKHSRWVFTAVEPSRDMLGIARSKITAKGLEDRVRWHEGPLYTLEEQEPFDAATCLLVLHFVPDNKKADLLESISNRLKPGALLLLSSFTGDPETTRTKKMFDLCQAWAIDQGAPPDEVMKNISLDRKDVFFVPEERIKNLFRETGYIDVQRLYQGLACTLWTARTPR
jgi:tRNA (cmo5U34)-methyltransferase